MKSIIIISMLLSVLSSCTGLQNPDYTQKRADSYQDFTSFRNDNVRKVMPAKIYTLSDCLQLALDNNLELYAMKLEQAVADDKSMGHLLTALPSLQTSYNFTARDNEPGATSEGIDDGLESLRSSKSTDKSIGNFRFELALSSLDFGLAYINSCFEKDQKRKAFVNRKKAERELKFQVVQAYFSVASAQYVLQEAKNELLKNEAALQKIESLFEKQHISRFELLHFKKKFLEKRRQLREYERSHDNYSLNLTALLGLTPDKKIKLDLSIFECDPTTGRFKLDFQPPAYKTLEKNALHLREELIEMDIESHVSLLKEKSEMLKMFPNVRLFAAFNNSSNSFLYNRSWSEAGINAVVDLLKIPSRMKSISAEEKQRLVIKYRQFSTMINIIAQIKIALANIEEVNERLLLKEDLYSIVQQEEVLTKKAVEKGTKNQLDLMEKEIDLVISNIQRTAAFANYNVALHRLLSISCSPQKELLKLHSKPPAQ